MKLRSLSLLLALSVIFASACTSSRHTYKTKMTKRFHKKEKVGHTPKKGNVFSRMFSSN